ncbi:MAG: hypothetical protein JRJ26_18310 [Deltaproteobacteria bacterium]|nr:hypothetical protein [Deltaproteobacteria bacterium]
MNKGLGIDAGGTFTDLVVVDLGTRRPSGRQKAERPGRISLSV